MTDKSDNDNTAESGAEIIPLPSTRGDIERAKPVDPAACRHFGATRLVDEKRRTIHCEACDGELDPIDCMMEIVNDRDRYKASIKHFRDEEKRALEEFETAKKKLAAEKSKVRAEKKKGAVAEERKRMLVLTQGALDRFCNDIRTETSQDFANAEGMLYGLAWVARGLFAGTEYPELEGLLRRISAGEQELDARRRRMAIRPARNIRGRSDKREPKGA